MIPLSAVQRLHMHLSKCRAHRQGKHKDAHLRRLDGVVAASLVPHLQGGVDAIRNAVQRADQLVLSGWLAQGDRVLSSLALLAASSLCLPLLFACLVSWYLVS